MEESEMRGHPKISMKAARVNAGLTQREAAERLKITRPTLQNYEEGRTVPNWGTVKEMERLYRYPADYIFFSKNLALSEMDSLDEGEVS